MTAIVIFFMIIAAIFALASLAYVAVDLVLEVLKQEEPQAEPQPIVVVAPPPPPPVVEEPPEEIPEIVEHIVAEEADALMTDEKAMETARYESGEGHGKQGIINIGLINQHFEANDLVTLAILKQKKLVPKNVCRLKVLADGILEKPLTVKSESYSVQAIKMIELTGGTVIILRD